MPDDDDKKIDADKNDHHPDDDDMAKLKARMQEAEADNDILKAKLKKFEKDEDEADKNSRGMELERDQFERDNEKLTERVSRLEVNLVSERFAAKIDQLRSDGYKVGDAKNQKQILDRVVSAQDPKAELSFLKQMMGRHPVGVHVSQAHAVSASGTDDDKNQKKAGDTARDRCTAEEAPEKFGMYFEQELAKLG